MRIENTAERETIELLLDRAGIDVEGSGGPVDLSPVAADGSDRKFFRIRRGATRLIALMSPRQREEGTDENDSYFLIGKHLFRHGIPVPQILWADPRRGCFLMEDVGDVHLQRVVARSRVDRVQVYRRVLQLLVRLHERAPDGFEPGYCFDTPLYDPPFVYRRELEYFRTAFLVTALGLEVSAEALKQDFEDLAEAAGVTSPRFVMHRDFQSRNLMVWKSGLRLLDFQGMRYGPPAYDLASLLADPYVIVPFQQQEALAGLYWTAARRFLGGSTADFVDSYRAVRLCRNLQALGAYGFLGIVKGKTQFLRYIPRAWEGLRLWLNGPCKGRYPALQRWVRSVQENPHSRRLTHRFPESFS